MSKTCGNCFYSELSGPWDQDDDDPDLLLLCNYPQSKMPLCMQGYAQRERRLVMRSEADCPTWKG